MQDGKHVILCVDDDPDILECLQLVLEKNNYVAVTAQSAEDGLKLFQKHQPDLIICDLMMEEIDSGTSFVTKLKAEGNQAPIYILSSIGDNLNLNLDFSELGLNGVFQKPIDNDMLLSVLKTKLK
ncbi:MAG: response regulator [Sedimentisphaerales bacterium]|nr:response regulator [Sedimentisphaerales bacterium]